MERQTDPWDAAEYAPSPLHGFKLIVGSRYREFNKAEWLVQTDRISKEGHCP